MTGADLDLIANDADTNGERAIIWAINELTRAVGSLAPAVDAARAIGRVRALHAPEDFPSRVSFVSTSRLSTTEFVCKECGGNDAEYPAPWPCATIAAIEATS